MATVVNTRDVLLLAASPRVLWAGIRGLLVSADTASFKVSSGGSPTPSVINLSVAKNGVNGTVNWSVIFGTATLTSSTGDTNTLTYVNMSSTVITVKVTVTDGGVVWSDSMTLQKILDGTNGTNGTNGTAGATGTTGASSRIAYTKTTYSLSPSPSTSVVSGDTMPSTGTWGEANAWQISPPVIGVGEQVWQTTGTYNFSTNQTTWVAPYLSNLKVGTLSAITINTGTLTVDSTGYIRGGQTAYNTGNGFWLGYSSGDYKLSIGNSNTNFAYDGTTLVISSNTGLSCGNPRLCCSCARTCRRT